MTRPDTEVLDPVTRPGWFDRSSSKLSVAYRYIMYIVHTNWYRLQTTH